MVKKVASLFLIFIMLLPVISLADIPNVTKMSDDELHQTISAVYTKLEKRSLTDSNIILRRDGITVSRNGEAYVERLYLRIPVIILNETDEATTLVPDGCVINGWTVTALAPDFAEPHSQIKTELVFKIDEAECATIEDIKTIGVKYYVEMKVDGMYSYNKEISELNLIP